MKKVAIVTGANHGIGEAIAIKLATSGYDVVITWLDPDNYTYADVPRDRLHHTFGGKVETDRVVDSIKKNGGNAVGISLDLSRIESIAPVFDLAEKAFGPVNTLINNAAHGEDSDTIESLNSMVVDRTYSVNVKGPILMIQEFLLRYKKSNLEKGVVVNISTDAAQYFAGQINYGASKAALEAYTRSLAIELGKYGIRINTVAPGPVHTGMPKSYITKEMEEGLNKKIPLRRCGYPDDIAKAVNFFVSDESDWITGQVLRVDGGHTWGRCV